MAQTIPSPEALRNALRQGEYMPVYVLHGEEGWYVDALLKEFDKIIPDPADKQFSEFIFYATETEPGRIIDQCRQVPMMASRQVVIVKECQAAATDVNKLHSYVSSPNPDTILVLCFRGAVAKGKELLAAVRKSESTAVFEGKKITENTAPNLIRSYIKHKGMGADAKSLDMLYQHIGNNLGRLYNEIDKLAASVPPGATITPELVELNIGVSREYNSFELVDALARRDAAQSFRIAAYFRSNPKAAPLVMVLASIFSYFADLFTAWYTDRTDRGIMEALGLKSTFQVRRFKTGLANYKPMQVVEIIRAIRTFDVRSKGVDSRLNEHELFHELIYHILTAPGIVK